MISLQLNIIATNLSALCVNFVGDYQVINAPNSATLNKYCTSSHFNLNSKTFHTKRPIWHIQNEKSFNHDKNPLRILHVTPLKHFVVQHFKWRRSFHIICKCIDVYVNTYIYHAIYTFTQTYAYLNVYGVVSNKTRLKCVQKLFAIFAGHLNELFFACLWNNL